MTGAIFDLDGTVYRGDAEVPGAAAFVRLLRDHGVATLFVTNRASRPPDEVGAQLTSLGMPCTPEDVLTSAQATAELLRKDSCRSVYCIGEHGLDLAMREAGLAITEEAPDAVVVSFDRGFTYDKLATACRLIDQGARFIATNPDKRLRTENSVLPGTGAIVAAVRAGTGVEPVVVGKPKRLIMDMALERIGRPASEVVAIGDNLETDIAAGEQAGLRTVLILTGISTPADLSRSAVRPTWTVKDYGELSDLYIRSRG